MNGYREDNDPCCRTGLFLILFFLLLLVTSGSYGSYNHSGQDSSSKSELVGATHQNAITFKTTGFFHFQKHPDSLPQNTRLSLNSIRNRLLDYNRKICLNLIIIRKTKLSSTPAFPLKLYFHLPDNKDEIPVLS